MHPAERGSYVTLPARLSQWDFNYGPAIDRSIQMSDYQKDDRRQMNRDVQATINLIDAIEELRRFDNEKLFPYIESLFTQLEALIKPSPLIF